MLCSSKSFIVVVVVFSEYVSLLPMFPHKSDLLLVFVVDSFFLDSLK